MFLPGPKELTKAGERSDGRPGASPAINLPKGEVKGGDRGKGVVDAPTTPPPQLPLSVFSVLARPREPADR